MTTISRSSGSLLVMWLVAGVGLVSGCTTEDVGPAAGSTTPSAPVSVTPTGSGPTGSGPTGSGTAAPAENCDPAASYRPPAKLPSPDDLPVGSTMAEIKARGRLIVGTAGDKPLLAVRDPETGTLEGIDIDLAREVSRAIFGDPNQIEFRTITYAAREPALIAGDVDLVAHSMTMTCDRWQRVGFSTVYYRDGQRVLVRSDSPAEEVEDLADSTICVARGTTTIDNLRRLGVTNLVAVDDAADCLALFQRDEVDAITSNEIILLGYQQQDRYAKIIGRDLSDEPRGLAFAREDVDFIRFVNAVLDRRRADGTLERILKSRLDQFDVPVSVEKPTYRREPS